MMEKSMCLKLDHYIIVQFFGWFDTRFGKAMVFKTLDISLQDFILETDCAPMLLSDVSIQQLATAFDVVKSIGLIHVDFKLDNIMMVDHQRQPFRDKLIDFGLAMHTSKARQGMTMQVVPFRALEILFDLPFSEAMYIWAYIWVFNENICRASAGSTMGTAEGADPPPAVCGEFSPGDCVGLLRVLRFPPTLPTHFTL